MGRSEEPEQLLLSTGWISRTPAKFWMRPPSHSKTTVSTMENSGLSPWACWPDAWSSSPMPFAAQQRALSPMRKANRREQEIYYKRLEEN